MKTHSELGGKTLEEIESRLNYHSFLAMGRDIAYDHHERWDGSGYPKGLAGEEIPLSARIVALADVYDALTTKRPYKQAFSHEQAREIILAGDGSHFDPDVVRAFLESQDAFLNISKRFGEKDPAD